MLLILQNVFQRNQDNVPVPVDGEEDVPVHVREEVHVDGEEERKVSMPVDGKGEGDISMPVEEKVEGDVFTNDTIDEKGKEVENTHSEKPKGLFSNFTKLFTGGNKDQYSSDEEEIAYNKYKTMMFHQEDEDEGLMQHMKNMTSKKYLTTLTSQDLKDIMKNNQMKVTNNGSYYNKKEMISKIVKFYK